MLYSIAMPSLPKPKRISYRPPPPERKLSTDYAFYNSQRWRNHSKRSRLTCEVCEANGLYTQADVLDHIVPMRNHDGARWDQRNHMGMCHPHHNQKRGMETHGHCVETAQGIDGLVPYDRQEVIRALLGIDNDYNTL